MTKKRRENVQDLNSYKTTDLQNIRPEYKDWIDNIEKKPHSKYIKYLLTKKYSADAVNKELIRLGLSCPSSDQLKTYFLYVMLPLIEKFDLVDVYEDYIISIRDGKGRRNKISGNNFYVLKFISDFDKNEKGRINFCRLLKVLDIDCLWADEIFQFYGDEEALPLDDKGSKIIDISRSKFKESITSTEKILLYNKRFLVDKLLLDNVSPERIARILKNNYNSVFTKDDIANYSRIFFNYKRRDLESTIEELEDEKNNLSLQLRDLMDRDDISLGEKATMTSKLEIRIKELDKTIKELNATYSDVAFNEGTLNNLEITDMFKDVIKRSYARFKNLDRYNDVDIVDSLNKLVRAMSSSATAYTSLIDNEEKMKKKDKNLTQVLLELTEESVDQTLDIAEAKKVQATLARNQIEGVDDV